MMERDAIEQYGRCRRIVTEGWMLPPWQDIPYVETWADCRLPSKPVRISGGTDQMPVFDDGSLPCGWHRLSNSTTQMPYID